MIPLRPVSGQYPLPVAVSYVDCGSTSDCELNCFIYMPIGFIKYVIFILVRLYSLPCRTLYTPVLHVPFAIIRSR